MAHSSFASRNPWLLALVGALAGLVLGVSVGYFKAGVAPSLVEVREFQSTYKYINPLLACGDENFAQLSNEKTIELERKIDSLIAERKKSGTVTDGAVYFREFNGGTWLGINEDAFFTPGSLLKVPLAMSVYKHAERDPAFLDLAVEYEGGTAPGVEHFVSQTIQPGIFSVRDLVYAMLVHSDNTAAVLLTKLISPQELDDSYSHLGISTPSRGVDYTMSVKVYASFFRILYNATYLDHDPSEHLLDTLSLSVFRDGIVAGVPSGVVVAHKFGERAIEGEASVQLHDCGVIYHPKQPYLLCVMMRGSDSDALAGVIRDISKVTYSYAE